MYFIKLQLTCFFASQKSFTDRDDVTELRKPIYSATSFSCLASFDSVGRIPQNGKVLEKFPVKGSAN